MEEIERKWKLRRVPEVVAAHCKPNRLVQIYVVASGDGEVRLRKDKNGFTLTFKSAGSLVRVEENYSLESSLGFELLLPLTRGGCIVEKDRFTYSSERHGVIEVDCYRGYLNGLVVMEREFPNVVEATAFELPGWAIEEGALEVTEDKRYKNKYLAMAGVVARKELSLD